ncbi:hypothetical protein VTK73DRAFT_6012 [Phialemonium thermophilum]|uniref:Uncharacterized protein n=1 Tax=Phialemonium thermophilum TaxID=223376 RepID=A0ABR3V0D9_9PEZI
MRRGIGRSQHRDGQLRRGQDDLQQGGGAAQIGVGLGALQHGEEVQDLVGDAGGQPRGRQRRAQHVISAGPSCCVSSESPCWCHRGACVELQGANRGKGRHGRGKGFEERRRKKHDAHQTVRYDDVEEKAVLDVAAGAIHLAEQGHQPAGTAQMRLPAVVADVDELEVDEEQDGREEDLSVADGGGRALQGRSQGADGPLLRGQGARQGGPGHMIGRKRHRVVTTTAGRR